MLIPSQSDREFSQSFHQHTSSARLLQCFCCKKRIGHLYKNVQVIILDPMYDAYAAMAQRAGAKVVPVKLNEADWSIPRAGLEAAFNENTKLILVNTPHNPTGKVKL